MEIILITLRLWRFYQMAKNTADMIKGVGAGLVAGVMFGLVSSVMLKDSRKDKKKATRAIGAVENILDGMKDVFS